MSIEALLQNIWSALDKNTAALDRLEASLVGRASGKSKEELAKTEKPKAESKPEVNEEKKPEPEVKEDKKPLDLSDENTSYETLRELVLKLASAGKRDEIKAVSAKNGITAPKDLLKDPADMSSVTDQTKLEAVYADLLALEA